MSHNPLGLQIFIALAEYRPRHMVAVSEMRRDGSNESIIISGSNANAAFTVLFPFHIFITVIAPQIILYCWDNFNLGGAGKGPRYTDDWCRWGRVFHLGGIVMNLSRI